jgi:hypothetical protein
MSRFRRRVSQTIAIDAAMKSTIAQNMPLPPLTTGTARAR